MLFGIVYPIVGILFALPANSAVSNEVRVGWRLAAWFVAAVTFAVHIAYEHRARRSSPFRAALHVTAGVAIGAFLLAVWVNVHLHWVASSHQSPLAPLALVVFPVVTGVPAFLVAFLAAIVLTRMRPR